MAQVFHGNDAETHDAFQAWRREHPGGFQMSESAAGQFTIHYAQDRRESADGRGCTHQGCSDNAYREDKGGCYTATRKVCAEDLAELHSWAAEHGYSATNCTHCDKEPFSFPVKV